jgi:pimeloyl-ACP methyl ester carboxylesterase
MAVTYRVPGAVLTEREHSVPLDHAKSDGPSITVFSREVAAPDGKDRPYLLFLQGGPGFEATRPTSPPSGWMKRALADYRVLLLDQRGTGRSTPVGSEVPGKTPPEQAEYLTHFRADSIVRDAELIRRELGVERWSVLGQSFGGFTSMTYLSIAPDGLREAFITGGLAPIGRPVDDIYGATYIRAIEKNRAYFERYPDDRKRADDIFRRLDAEEVRLPSGDRLTAARFRQLGLWLGDSAGWELLHHVLELPFGSLAFLHDAQDGVRFQRNPIYATLHESSYADGVPTRWSADRLLPAEIAERGYFTGEHVFRWMWEDYAALRSHREAAELLAEHPWPRLYDADQLRKNDVPVAATIYVNDLYVERRYAEETAATIRGLRPWITNEYEHNGLRADGERVLGRLIDLVRGRVWTVRASLDRLGFRGRPRGARPVGSPLEPVDAHPPRGVPGIPGVVDEVVATVRAHGDRAVTRPLERARP